RESGEHRAPREPAGDLHDAISRTRRRPCQEPGGRSLPLCQRTQHSPPAHGIRQTKRTDVYRLAAAQRRKIAVSACPAVGRHARLSTCNFRPALDSQSLQGETRFSPFAMQGAAHPEDRFPPASAENVSVGRDRPSSVGSAGVVGDPSNGSSTLAETELDSALQLLVERAQYITCATGTALALPQGEEMVCRASAGSSAPA